MPSCMPSGYPAGYAIRGTLFFCHLGTQTVEANGASHVMLASKCFYEAYEARRRSANFGRHPPGARLRCLYAGQPEDERTAGAVVQILARSKQKRRLKGKAIAVSSSISRAEIAHGRAALKRLANAPDSANHDLVAKPKGEKKETPTGEKKKTGRPGRASAAKKAATTHTAEEQALMKEAGAPKARQEEEGERPKREAEEKARQEGGEQEQEKAGEMAGDDASMGSSNVQEGEERLKREAEKARQEEKERLEREEQEKKGEKAGDDASMGSSNVWWNVGDLSTEEFQEMLLDPQRGDMDPNHAKLFEGMPGYLFACLDLIALRSMGFTALISKAIMLDVACTKEASERASKSNMKRSRAGFYAPYSNVCGQRNLMVSTSNRTPKHWKVKVSNAAAKRSKHAANMEPTAPDTEDLLKDATTNKDGTVYLRRYA